MPGFISHTVMAKDVYKKLGNKNISLEHMMTYSLGGDLSKYAKCRYDSHHKDMDKFIYNMADYIKMNNLINDSDALGVLYAHICHYVMDKELHPFIWKVTQLCVSNKKNHTWLEQYYNDYLVSKVVNISLGKYVKGKILGAKMNRKISRLIDYVYLKTYDTKNISRYYRFNLFLYRLERILMILNAKGWYKLNGLNKFLDRNKNVDLINDNKSNLLILYKESIKDALLYIDRINKYMKEA